jgi:hypothetical protein
MRRKSYFFDDRAGAEVIATFGGAQLVKQVDGKMELRGGSAEDQQQARDWVKTFMPGALGALPRPADRRKK